MNKILASLFIAASAFALTGCVGEEDEIFDKSAAERLNEVSGIYTQRLASSEGGRFLRSVSFSRSPSSCILVPGCVLSPISTTG